MRPIKYRCLIKQVNNPEFEHLVGKFLYSDDGNNFRFIISPVGGRYIERLSDSLTITEDDWDQFTGLTDKNGNEIYDGDWLGIPSHKSKVNYNIRRGGLCMGWERLTAYKASKIQIVREPGITY